MNEPLVRRYYECFNDRRFAGAAAMMADDAELGLLSMGRERGPAGYLHFAKLWTAAFPDARFSLKGIEPRGETLCEAYLTATGTQEGILEFGVYRFNPTGVNTRLNMRELLDIRADKITASMLTVDLNDLIAQLASVDYEELTRCLQRIRVLGEEVARARGDGRREHGVLQRLGRELDAARRTLRPHFNRQRAMVSRAVLP